MRVPATQPDYPLTAVGIRSNAGTVPDVIRVIYGGVTQTTAAVKFGNDMDTEKDPIQLVSRFGFCPADVVVMGQPNSVCTLREVTKLSGLVELDHDQSAYLGGRDATGTCMKEARTPRFNNPTGTPLPYKFMQGAKVMNLGPFPVRNEITGTRRFARPEGQQSADRAEPLGADGGRHADSRADRPSEGGVRHGQRQEQRHRDP